MASVRLMTRYDNFTLCRNSSWKGECWWK